MEKTRKYLASAAALCCLAAAPQVGHAQYDHGPENTLRIATYNIYNGKTADAKAYNYEKQARIRLSTSLNGDCAKVRSPLQLI